MSRGKGVFLTQAAISWLYRNQDTWHLLYKSAGSRNLVGFEKMLERRSQALSVWPIVDFLAKEMRVDMETNSAALLDTVYYEEKEN